MFQKEVDDTLLLKHLFYIATCIFCYHLILLYAERDKLQLRQLLIVSHSHFSLGNFYLTILRRPSKLLEIIYPKSKMNSVAKIAFLHEPRQKKSASLSQGGFFHIIRFRKLLILAQLLVAFVAELSKLFSLGEQFLGFLWEGLQQRVVTDFAHDELLELAEVRFLAV